MPTANRDSSELTRKRRAMALYGYATVLQAAQRTSNIVRREQPTVQMLNVYTEARQGGCYCADANAGVYEFNGPGGCGC
jgi:hypothetical protein